MASHTATPETASPDLEQGEKSPACITRDNLTSEYFPQTRRSLLAAVVVLSLVYLFVSVHRLNHTDLWGHLNFGRWIVQQGELPAADPFAAGPPVDTFVNVPWLAQVLGYLTWQTLGAEGLVLSHALLVVACCGGLMAAIARRGVPLSGAVVGGAAAIVLALPVIGTIRPQLFGMLGVPLVLAGLDRLAESPRRWPIAAAFAAMFALWANLHGSFAVGLLLVGLFAVARTVEMLLREHSVRRVAGDAETRGIWLTLAAAVLGACLNPLGPWLLVEVARFGGHAPLDAISEWRTLAPWSVSGVLFFGSLAGTALTLRAGGRSLSLFETLVLAVFGLLTISAMRMLVWWAVIWPWVMAPHAHAAWRRWRSPGTAEAPPDSTPREASMRTLIALATIFMVLLLAPPSLALLTGQPRGPARVLGNGTPLYVAAEMRRRELQGGLFAPMDWADYLVWKTDGKLRPLVYSHVHLIPEANWNDYRRIAAGDPNWEALARAHQIRYLLLDVRRNAELRRRVFENSRSAHPATRVIYQDRHCLLAELLESGTPSDS